MRPQHSSDCVKQRDRHRYFFINTCFMLNKSENLPTAAVISDRQATSGSDMATSPAYQQPVDNISKNYPCPGALAESVSNAHDGQGAWPFPRGEQSVPSVGTVGSPLRNRQFQASELAVGSVRTNGTEAWHQACQPQEPEVAAVGTDSALPVHVLCSDPYAWFSQRGQRLHSCSIGILPSPRSNGVLYTGTFNIDGFIYTVGSPSIDGLYYEAMAKRCRHLQGIRGRQQRKKQRCALRYIERYPGAELPRWFAPSEN